MINGQKSSVVKMMRKIIINGPQNHHYPDNSIRTARYNM